MAMDLTAPGAKVLAGDGGGTAPGDPFTQAVEDGTLATAIGAPDDDAWTAGAGSVIALLKALIGKESNAAVSGSGVIANGGVAQQLFGGATPVHGYLIQNTDAVNDLFVDDARAAQAADGKSMRLTTRVAPQTSIFITPPGYAPPGPVSVYGAQAGQTFFARSW